MTAPISRDEWLAALGEAALPADPDALTTIELGEMFGISAQAAYRRVRALMREGRAVRTCKTITDVGGYPKRVPAYRLVKHEARPATRKR